MRISSLYHSVRKITSGYINKKHCLPNENEVSASLAGLVHASAHSQRSRYRLSRVTKPRASLDPSQKQKSVFQNKETSNTHPQLVLRVKRLGGWGRFRSCLARVEGSEPCAPGPFQCRCSDSSVESALHPHHGSSPWTRGCRTRWTCTSTRFTALQRCFACWSVLLF